MGGENTMPDIIRKENLLSYFEKMVSAAAFNQNLEMDDCLRLYLVNLLAYYLKTENLCPRDIDSLHEPLAIIFKKATESEGHSRYKLLKHLGDISLYISGFFSDSINKKSVGIEYYISMGSTAYDVLSISFDSKRSSIKHNEIFCQLSRDFANYVEVFSEISEKALLTSNKDIMKLYEKWLKTKNERTAQLLEEHGINPSEFVISHYHH
jgi:hypothetical protein